MSDVHETLQELVVRRLRELGRSRGSNEPLPLRQVHQKLPVGDNGKPVVSYETFRQIEKGVHSGRITDITADAVALAFDVDVDDVLVAAGQRPRTGEFELPTRAQQLTRKERRVVMGVINAILDARGVEAPEGEEGGELLDLGQGRQERRRRLLDQALPQKKAGYEGDEEDSD